MSDQSTYDLRAMMEMATRSPMSFQRVGIDYMQAKLGGDVIPDPLSPLVQLLEIGSTQSVVAINEALALDRRRYAVLANTQEDLYCVMSDTDYLGRFSSPAQMPAHLLMPYDQMVNAMVLDTTTRMSRLVIPRYTRFTVKNDYAFTLLHPIEVRLLSSGELQVVYNTEQTSPLQPIATNLLDHELVNFNGVSCLRIDVPQLLQLSRVTSTMPVNNGAALSWTLPFEDSYYYARVWTIGSNGVATEMVTTHAEIQHDVRTPTAYLQVDTDARTLRVAIPPVYVSNGTLGSQVRVDIYSTKGPLSVPLSGLMTSQFRWEYAKDLDDPALDLYSANITNITGMTFWSDGTIYGGTTALTFEELRRRTLYRYTKGQLPITPDQAEITSSEAGYQLTLARDDISNRVYYASREAPVDPASTFTTPIPSGICTMELNMASLAKLPGVYDNNLRVTFSPKTLFAIVNGVTSPLDAAQYPTASADSLVAAVNAKEYVYSPFYYVLDANDNAFDLRAYYLESTALVSRQFLAENSTTQLSLRSDTVEIERTANGWKVRMAVIPSSGYSTLDPNDVYCQLAYVPQGETLYAFMNGTLLGVDTKGRWIWEWTLEGTYDFTKGDAVLTDNWAMLDNSMRTLPVPLTTEFSVIHAVANYTIPGMAASDFESRVGRQILPDSAVAVQLESVTLQLGLPLTNLWRGARTVTGSQTFETYLENVYAFAENDVVATDPETELPIYTIEDGVVTYVYKYRKGDPILNPDGTQQIAHYKDTVKYLNGNPVVATPRTVNRIVDVFMLSGLYYYANDAASKADAKYLADTLCTQYLPDMATLLGKPMELTSLYFYPRRSLGDINIIANNNESLMASSQVTVAGTVYLTDTAYTSDSYRQSVMRILTNVITAKLRLETVSLMDIQTTLKENLDTQVIGVDLTISIDGEVMNTFSAGNAVSRTNIRRLLQLNEDGTLGVGLDVQLEWSTHVPPSSALYSKVIGGRTYTSN